MKSIAIVSVNKGCHNHQATTAAPHPLMVSTEGILDGDERAGLPSAMLSAMAATPEGAP